MTRSFVQIFVAKHFGLPAAEPVRNDQLSINGFASSKDSGISHFSKGIKKSPSSSSSNPMLSMSNVCCFGFSSPSVVHPQYPKTIDSTFSSSSRYSINYSYAFDIIDFSF